MTRWFARLAIVFFSLLATACAGGTLLGAAAAETQIAELLVTCLTCGEQWIFAPPATLGAGLLSLLTRRKPADKCPKCGSRAVKFGHTADAERHAHGRTA